MLITNFRLEIESSFDKHSLRARCSDLGMAFESIQCGRYGGANWIDGALKIINNT